MHEARPDVKQLYNDIRLSASRYILDELAQRRRLGRINSLRSLKRSNSLRRPFEEATFELRSDIAGGKGSEVHKKVKS